MLRKLQLEMMDALYDGRVARAAALIDAPKPEARARFKIYRNTVRGNFTEALRLTYPVLCRLVGDPYFQQLAHAFRLRQASTSGDLQQCGARFSYYLADLHRADEYAYLAHVARLEWIIQESLLSTDHGPLSLTRLAGTDASQYESLQFVLHPALRLFDSSYPVLRIWEVNADSAREPDLIGLESGADRLIVIRHAAKLRFHRLSAGDYRFLLAIESGAPFLAALDAATEIDEEFDATSTLQRCVAMNAIVDFQ